LETTTKEATLRKNLRELGLKGNGSYSLKEVDESPIEYIAYMMKEGQFYNCGISQEVIDKSRLYDIEVKKEIKSKKESKKTQLQRIEAYVSERLRSNGGVQVITFAGWIRHVIEWFKDEGTLFREFQVVSLAQTLFLKNNPEGVKVLEHYIKEKIKLI